MTRTRENIDSRNSLKVRNTYRDLRLENLQEHREGSKLQQKRLQYVALK